MITQKESYSSFPSGTIPHVGWSVCDVEMEPGFTW